jgi:hypothetical protein
LDGGARRFLLADADEKIIELVFSPLNLDENTLRGV